jgi:hypothetical protein
MGLGDWFSDDPERHLSGAPIGLADIPDGEAACQQRAPISDIEPAALDTQHRT